MANRIEILIDFNIFLAPNDDHNVTKIFHMTPKISLNFHFCHWKLFSYDFILFFSLIEHYEHSPRIFFE